MSDNEQHDPTPQLTRRQLRELRNTASNPVITEETLAAAAESAEDPAPTPAPSAPLPRAAEPVVVPDPPVSEASIDLGARALTRRQARQQEKIRTASVPIITPDLVHANDVSNTAAGPDVETAPETDVLADEVDATEASEDPVDEARRDSPADEPATHADSDAAELETPDDDAIDADAAPASTEPVAPDATREDASEQDDLVETDLEDLGLPTADGAQTDDAAEHERHVVSEELGAALLARSASESAQLPSSFDQLLSRSAAATGAFTAPNALILAQSPDAGPLVAPVTATGEVLITGTFALPDRFGSTGVVPGSADGIEADAVLVDGELPASSSPTPIAASAAISTIKSAEDVIRPPAPEKGGRTMIFLAITAGVLAAALAGVLVVALFTGVFSS